MERICDLHTHTKCSDGTLTPSELMAHALDTGLFAIALTDHNSAAGLPEFFSAAEGKDIEPVGGVELSCDYNGREIHIVGLFLSLDDAERVELLMKQMKENKIISNKNLISALAADGYDISYEAVEAQANGYMNRAHIATHLVNRGYFNNRQEAFDSILQPYGKYYVPPKTITAFEGIEFLGSLGAVSVVAHPYLSLPEGELDEFLRRAVESGLDAMETIYTTYDEETTAKAKEMAQKHGLLESGGSDFHGETKPDVALGTGRGGVKVTPDIYEKLKARRDEKRKVMN